MTPINASAEATVQSSHQALFGGVRGVAMLLLLTIASGDVTPAAAGKHHPQRCCAQCGCACRCGKVCRLECTEKETPVNIWGVECEDFCIGSPGTPKCDCCRSLHDAEAKDPPCSCPKLFTWTTWLPGCHAKLFTHKKLYKQVATVKTPTYKWVVEDLCSDCQAACRPVRVPAGTKLPPRPPLEDAIVVAAVEEPLQ